MPENFTLTLSIPWLPKSLNKKLRSNRWKNHRENISWDNYIANACYNLKPPKPLTYARIKIVRHAHRFLDFDGCVGSLKPVVDALVTAGVFADDSYKVLGDWAVSQEFRPKKLGPLLEIFIEGN